MRFVEGAGQRANTGEQQGCAAKRERDRKARQQNTSITAKNKSAATHSILTAPNRAQTAQQHCDALQCDGYRHQLTRWFSTSELEDTAGHRTHVTLP